MGPHPELIDTQVSTSKVTLGLYRSSQKTKESRKTGNIVSAVSTRIRQNVKQISWGIFSFLYLKLNVQYPYQGVYFHLASLK